VWVWWNGSAGARGAASDALTTQAVKHWIQTVSMSFYLKGLLNPARACPAYPVRRSSTP
jgi:hypothetical protein